MKAFKKTLFTAIGVVLAAAGVVALINPAGVAALLVYIVGLVILLSGVATAVAAFLPKFAEGRNVLVVLAVANILLGGLIMLMHNVYILLTGFGMLLAGCSLIVISLQCKKQGLSWLGSMCAAIAAVVLGFVLMLFFQPIQAIIGVILGAAFLVAGIILIVIGLSASKQGSESNG